MDNFDFKKYIAENKLTENVEETALNEAVSDFTPEEIELLRDGLGLIIDQAMGVAPESYIDEIKALIAKLG
jgi:hypothetical protein